MHFRTLNLAVLALSFSGTTFAAGWNYDENDLVNGPVAWGGTCTATATSKQSPIDLGVATRGANPALTINYKYTELNVVNNGHTVQVNVNNGSTLTINGKVYDLLQFHFHTPSEHQIAGRAYPMEVHFVNREQGGTNLAVIGVFMRAGEPNSTFQKILNVAPIVEGEAHSTALISPIRLLGDDEREYYGYQGSLTTPPCSEIVTWNVLEETISVSAEQIAYFKGLIHEGHNARPVQDVNGRSVIKSVE